MSSTGLSTGLTGVIQNFNLNGSPTDSNPIKDESTSSVIQRSKYHWTSEDDRRLRSCEVMNPGNLQKLSELFPGTTPEDIKDRLHKLNMLKHRVRNRSATIDSIPPNTPEPSEQRYRAFSFDSIQIKGCVSEGNLFPSFEFPQVPISESFNCYPPAIVREIKQGPISSPAIKKRSSQVLDLEEIHPLSPVNLQSSSPSPPRPPTVKAKSQPEFKIPDSRPSSSTGSRRSSSSSLSSATDSSESLPSSKKLTRFSFPSTQFSEEQMGKPLPGRALTAKVVDSPLLNRLHVVKVSSPTLSKKTILPYPAPSLSYYAPTIRRMPNSVSISPLSLNRVSSNPSFPSSSPPPPQNPLSSNSYVLDDNESEWEASM